MQKCDRCKSETKSFIMSKFNTQMICDDCKTKEKNHHMYKQACDEELRQIKEFNNMNFEGIGLPDDLIEN
jgi:hypothetical protein